MFYDEGIDDDNKILYTWEEVYDCKKKTDNISLPLEKRDSEKYKKSVEKEIKKYGMMSLYCQTQYYVSFSSQGSRFTTIEILREANIFSGGKISDDYIDIREEVDINDKEHIYFVVAGIDPATTNDYAVFATGLAKVRRADREVINFTLKAVKIMNPDLKQISPETLVDRCAMLCRHYMVDMCMIDATGNQHDRAYYLWKKLKEIECNTMVIPFYYANENKQKMMKSLEDSILSRKIQFPNEEESSIDEYYSEFVDEILYLQKLISKGANGKKKIEYMAPQTTGYYDDCVMAVSQANYICYYIKFNLIENLKKNKKINLGDGISYKLDYHKNNLNRKELNSEFGRVGASKKKKTRIGTFRR